MGGSEFAVLDVAQMELVTDGDPEFCAEIIEVWRDTVRDDLQSLSKAIRERDDSTVRIAHNVKGAAANIGLLRVADVAAGLEVECRHGAFGQAAALMVALEEEVATAVAELKRCHLS